MKQLINCIKQSFDRNRKLRTTPKKAVLAFFIGAFVWTSLSTLWHQSWSVFHLSFWIYFIQTCLIGGATWGLLAVNRTVNLGHAVTITFLFSFISIFLAKSGITNAIFNSGSYISVEGSIQAFMESIKYGITGTIIAASMWWTAYRSPKKPD